MKNRGKEQYLARRLSFKEQDFIDTVETSIEHFYPNKFEFVNQINYIGIKTKGSHFSPFLFKKPDSKLIFHYFKAETKTFENIVIKGFDSGELDLIVNIIKKRYSDNFHTNSSQNSSDARFLEQANEKERAFINNFKKTIEIIYPKTFSFTDRIHYFGIKYRKQSEVLFQFKRKNNALIFISKSKYTLNQIIDISDYTEQFLDKVLKLIAKTIQLQRSEQLITNNSLDGSTSSFPESLETEQRRLVMSFKNIIEEHYPNSFDIFIDKKYLSFKEKVNDMPIFWFFKKNNELQFRWHPKAEEAKSMIIKSANKDSLVEIIKLAKLTADSFEVHAVKDKNIDNKKKIESPNNETTSNNKTPKIYSHIKDEILGLEYKALPSTKALCRNVKAYLLSTISESTGNNYENALTACDKELFFGNKLVWSEAAWLRSTKTIYCYFKANTLLEKIKDYEEVNEVKLVGDYPALLSHLYANLTLDKDIDYSNNLYFKEPLPNRLIRSLNEIEDNFKGYEIN